MDCKAITQGDGSKFCKECGVSWDMDEKKEDCCPKLREEHLPSRVDVEEYARKVKSLPHVIPDATKDR